jgi:hypothetical protein
MQEELPKQRDAVLHKIKMHPACFYERMPVDVDPVYDLSTGRSAMPRRTDHRDLIPRLHQGRGLIPDAAVERDRKIFDDDQNSPRL